MQLTGPAKAAMFLLSLPEERSVLILRHLDEAELKQLREAIDGLGPIAPDTIDEVFSEFAESFKRGVTSPKGGGAYLRSLVMQAFGEEEAVRLYAQAPALAGGDSGELGLGQVDPELLRVTLIDEHPQVAAVVLAHVDAGLAATVLEQMPDGLRMDLVARISRLTSISSAAYADARRVLGGLQLSDGDQGELDGTKTAANILNQLSQITSAGVLERIAEERPEDIDRLRNAMFTFENLLAADTRGLQALLREVPSDTLLAALKLASEGLKDKIFGCMSSRAADILREELEVMPPMRVSAVEEAQQQVVEVAMRLLGEGKISIEGRGEGLV